MNLELDFEWLEYTEGEDITKVILSDKLYKSFNKTTTYTINNITYDADATNRLIKIDMVAAVITQQKEI